RKTNPFLRPFSEEIRKSLNLGQVSDVEIFAALRERKDHFKV
ncbi:MAG: hydroxyacylglutathione hydrolase, partial [Bdellovibrio sp.]